jgi:hypothetical protein
MTGEKIRVGSLAMRVEGENWDAYYAMPNAMEGAIRLGSIRMAAIVDNPVRKQAFMDTRRDFVSDILEEVVEVRPAWPDPPYPAPEHERAGNS